MVLAKLIQDSAGKLSSMRLMCLCTVLSILGVFIVPNILNWVHHIYTITPLNWELVSLLAACLGLKLAQHVSESQTTTDDPAPPPDPK